MDRLVFVVALGHISGQTYKLEISKQCWWPKVDRPSRRIKDKLYRAINVSDWLQYRESVVYVESKGQTLVSLVGFVFNEIQ
jgi:hypothetical protein